MTSAVSIELSTLDETACALGASVFFIERFRDIRNHYIADMLKRAS